MATLSSPALALSDQQLKEVLEYEKILHLGDEILTGAHPRIKVPNFQPDKVDTPSFQQQRHAIEQILKHQLDEVSNETNRKNPPTDIAPHLNVAEVLEKALNLVHPVPYVARVKSATNAAATTPSAELPIRLPIQLAAVSRESFDKKSFYPSNHHSPVASVANSTQGSQTCEKGHGTLLEPKADLVDLGTAPNSPTSGSIHLRRTENENTRRAPYPVPRQNNLSNGNAKQQIPEIPPPNPSKVGCFGKESLSIQHFNRHLAPNNMNFSNTRLASLQDATDSDAAPNLHAKVLQSNTQNAQFLEGSKPQVDAAEAISISAPLPTGSLSPTAAITYGNQISFKPTQNSQTEISRASHNINSVQLNSRIVPGVYSDRNSPESSLHQNDENARKDPDKPKTSKSGPRVESSNPSIKEEPVSPSQSIVQPIPIKKSRALQSWRPLPYQDSVERELVRSIDNSELSAYGQGQASLPISRDLNTENLPSHILYPPRREPRGEDNPRPYASLRYARRAVSPSYTIQMSPTEYQPIQSTSRAIVESPLPRYYREANRPYTGHYIRSERSLSPPIYKNRYSPILREIMPPPPTHVDEFGRKYYPERAIRRSVAPSNCHAELEPVYDQGSVQHPATRVSKAIIAPSYEDDPFIERVPVGRISSISFRRVPEVQTLNYRTYRQRDYPTQTREIIPPRGEYVDIQDARDRRQVSHFEDIGISHEYPPRMQSVRPNAVVYEESPRQAEFVPQLQGLRSERSSTIRRELDPPQELREISVHPHEVRREHLPSEEDRRSFAGHVRRYPLEDPQFESPHEIIRGVYGDGRRPPPYRY
ncbi:MAG: hypothetical protein M1829_002177 [Trizodia sp. TS-e1964]|nr:MAG: hypothetical protein M1829_002177 [Trizodia sp. TS-e1964]